MTTSTSERRTVNNIAAVGILYRRSNPWEIFLERKDEGYPVEVFRNHLNSIGGNWIGDAALMDENPRDTFVRETCEELSLDHPMIETGEYEQIGIVGGESYRQTIKDVRPTDEDRAGLEAVKKATREGTASHGDFVIHVPAEVFARVPQKKVRGAFTVLVSFFAVPIDDELWRELLRLQEKFGNLSNEALTVLASLGRMVARDERTGWGHDQILQHFFRTMGFSEARDFPIIEGISVEEVGPTLPSYADYLTQYQAEKTPRSADLTAFVGIGVLPNAADARRDIYDLLHPMDFPEARHVNVICFKTRVSGKPWAVGNHFRHDWERFRIIKGAMKLILEDVITRERKVFENLSPGTVIMIPPLVSHAFLPGEGTVMAGALRKGFDPNDMKPYRIMDDDGNEIPSPAPPGPAGWVTSV